MTQTLKIVMLDGALVNQMTQYIFARCLEEELKGTDEQVLLDDLWFFHRHDDFMEGIADIEKHCYQLNKFPNMKHVKLMSEYFEPDVWLEIIEIAKKKPLVRGGSWLPQILKDSGLDLFMIAETSLFRFDGKVAKMPYYYYIPEMLQSQGDCYYFGWFTHGGWFMRHEEMFRKELELPPLWLPEDLDMARLIKGSTSISIHIRRGGYAAMGRTTPAEYFKTSLSNICTNLRRKNIKHIKPPHIFVFSDEIVWVKEHAEEFGLVNRPYPITYCKANRSELENQCDMQLMAMCDIMILECNSVYSYMAALLNEKKNKIVINPNKGRGIF